MYLLRTRYKYKCNSVALVTLVHILAFDFTHFANKIKINIFIPAKCLFSKTIKEKIDSTTVLSIFSFIVFENSRIDCSKIDLDNPATPYYIPQHCMMKVRCMIFNR